jgi:hypothetical protein
MIDRDRAKGVNGRFGFRIGDETYLARLAASEIEIERGPVEGADVVFTVAPPVMAAAVYGGVPLGALEAQGALKVEGDRALAERFVTLFVLPPKAERA